ncbi:hypothetical protein RvY_19240-2 [Ramazzottius varieornatus]|uniref:Uncharacterized protein n=1 Tax=Ramazzottius varieornatus TaxID=947166 RepID=A0A1D1WBR6_RAMVA|nr:hypothetical protein RvY_19240-2 [Ramazzottius varieornatus]
MHPASLLQSLDFSHFETDPSPSSTSRLVPPFTLPGYLQTMTLSCIAFTSLFLTLYYLLSRFTPFRRLDHGKSVARNLAGFLVSGIQAVTATIAGLIIITQTNSDILLAQVSNMYWGSSANWRTLPPAAMDSCVTCQRSTELPSPTFAVTVCSTSKLMVFLAVVVGELVFSCLRRLPSLRLVPNTPHRSSGQEISLCQHKIAPSRVHSPSCLHYSRAHHSVRPQPPRGLHHWLFPLDGGPGHLPAHPERPSWSGSVGYSPLCLQRSADHRQLLCLPAGHFSLYVSSAGPTERHNATSCP